MNYSQYVLRLTDKASTIKSDMNLTVEIPATIDYAEQRLYRELDLLATLVTDSTGQLTSGDRSFTLPTGIGTFITVENIAVLSPAGTPATTGARNPLMPVSLAVIDLLWPANSASTGLPTVFAMKDNATILVGPAPDGNYYVEVRGTQRPATLSSANTTTILTTYVPDLFLAASLVYVSGMAPALEEAYQRLKASAEVEQFRAKFQSQSWSSLKPTPANPVRN